MDLQLVLLIVVICVPIALLVWGIHTLNSYACALKSHNDLKDEVAREQAKLDAMRHQR